MAASRPEQPAGMLPAATPAGGKDFIASGPVALVPEIIGADAQWHQCLVSGLPAFLERRSSPIPQGNIGAGCGQFVPPHGVSSGKALDAAAK